MADKSTRPRSSLRRHLFQKMVAMQKASVESSDDDSQQDQEERNNEISAGTKQSPEDRQTGTCSSGNFSQINDLSSNQSKLIANRKFRVTPLNLRYPSNSDDENTLHYSPIPAQPGQRGTRASWEEDEEREPIRALPMSPAAYVLTSTPGPRHQSTSSNQTNSKDSSVFQFSDSNMCRICHEGESKEELISPCHCAGTMGMLHMSCLETWLGSSKTTKCEICQYQFIVKKKPRPFKWYLKQSNLQRERNEVIKDVIVSVVLVIVTVFVCCVCIMFGDHFAAQGDAVEGAVLILISVIIIILYLIWLMAVIRRISQTLRGWQRDYQVIEISRPTPPSRWQCIQKSFQKVSRRSQVKSEGSHTGTVEQVDILPVSCESVESYKAAMSNSILPHLPDPNNNDPRVVSLEEDQEESSILYYQPPTDGSCVLIECDGRGSLLRETGV